jgi:CubicO group peptidase (beta-lactamase class C family)
MTSTIKHKARRIAFKLTLVLLPVSAILIGLGVYLDLHIYFRPIPKDFNAAVLQQIDAAKFPSVTVLAFKKDKIIFSRGYGLANVAEKRAATPDTLYQIASISKLVVATALMRLHEQGLFKLDDDVNQYLPFTVRNPNYADTPITFRMLLAHTGSIGDGPGYWDSYTIDKSEDPSEPLGQFIKAYFSPDGHHYDASENFVDVKPGSQAEYSNVGFGLLGYLVERIAQTPFNEFCAQEIFKPLGMPTTQWFNRDVDKSKAAMPYGYNAFDQSFEPIGYYSFSNYPDGTLKTSTNEFMRFLYLFISEGKTLDGEQFLQPETVKEMLHVQYPQVGGFTGLAWHFVEDKYEHSGSDPGVSTLVLISPQDQWGFIMFANGGGLQAWRTELGKEIRHDLYEYIEQHGISAIESN